MPKTFCRSVLSLVTSAFLSISIASLILPVHARAGDDAEDVLEDIFDIVEKACPADGDGFPYNLANIAREYFSPDLATRLGQAYSAGTLDFDVLLDAQDCAITGLDVEVGDEIGGEALGRVTFRNLGEPREIDFVLKTNGRSWKVDNIVYRHRNWSLRRDVK